MFYLRLLIFINIINSLSIQAAPTIEQVGQLSLSNKTYQVNGQYLYAASCGGFEVFDLIDPLKPNLLANLPLISTDNCALKITINNSYAYVLSSHSIDIIDVSTPNKPKRVGNYEIPRNSTDYRADFIIAGQYGYLIIFNEILVLDLSNPLQPILVGNKVFETNTLLKAKVYGGQLVVRRILANYAGQPQTITDEILFLNLKNPTQFEQAGNIFLIKDTPIDYNNYYFTDGDIFDISEQYLYAMSINGNILAVDISNLSSPQQIGKYEPVEKTASGKIAINGKYLYFLHTRASDSSVEVLTLDISNPKNITLLNSYIVNNSSNSSVSGNFLYKQNLYINRGSLATIILDINQPLQPKEVARLFDGYIPSWHWSTSNGFIAKGNALYFVPSYKKSLVTIDISNPTLPKAANVIEFSEIVSPEFAINISSFAIDSNYLYFCNGMGLYSLDITNPLQPKKIGQYLLPAGVPCTYVSISGKYAYLIDVLDQGSFAGGISVPAKTQITVVDISSPTQLSKVGEYSINNRHLKKLVAKDEKVYVLALSTQSVNFTTYDYLHILDASNPSALKELSNYELPLSQSNIALVGQYAYFSGSSRLHIVDISNPNSPIAAGNYSNNSWRSGINSVSTGNNVLYISDNTSIFKLDVSNPAKPKQLAQILLTSIYGGDRMTATEPYIYSLNYHGVQVFKSIEVEAPQMTQIKGLANGACELNLSAKMLGADDGTGKNAGDFYLQWKETGRESTTSGDAVIAGYFYAPSEKVTWGSDANPEVYAKLWFSVNGMLNVNFFHVGVFDVQLASSYGVEMPQLNGGAALDHNKITIGRKAWRYSRHDYTNWRSCGKTDSALGSLKVEEVSRQTLKEMVNPKFTSSVFKSPSSSAAKININQQGSCELLMDAKMLNATSNGKPYGNLKLQWKEILRSTTSGGDTVIAGYFYASPNEVSWGSITNPEAYVKIWYARTGMLNVNFFHVGVFDIELTSSYKGSVPNGIDGYLTDDNNFINIWSDANRYSRHDYNNWKLCN